MTKTSQQLEIERYNREQEKWKRRKARWNAWKNGQPAQPVDSQPLTAGIQNAPERPV